MSTGFRMPAEWEKHEGTWFSWPYNEEETWAGHLDGAEKAFVEIFECLTPHERVHVLVPNESVKKRALATIEQSKAIIGNLDFHTIETGDIWIRDFGPIFVVKDSPKHEVAWTKWTYNALGNKFEALLIGNDAPDKMPIKHLPRFEGGMVLEGGSIDVNGTGTLLTTESVLLNPSRNPELSKRQIEDKLKQSLGVTNILWLSAGIAGDDTDGHVDDVTRFVNRNTVVTVIEEDSKDANYEVLQENLKRLKTMKIETGEPLKILTLPMPKAFIVDGRRMAASYANFLIANNVVLVPIYAQPSDTVALATLQKCFPDRRVIGIDCRELIWGCGSIHCASQQQPA
ncbi:agmatine deiminase family protein [Candidatus Peribacteria bacterium]|nr:agmatine deiminase family protein [Candidatus Peribacteria bacterium]